MLGAVAAYVITGLCFKEHDRVPITCLWNVLLIQTIITVIVYAFYMKVIESRPKKYPSVVAKCTEQTLTFKETLYLLKDNKDLLLLSIIYAICGGQL